MRHHARCCGQRREVRTGHSCRFLAHCVCLAPRIALDARLQIVAARAVQPVRGDRVRSGTPECMILFGSSSGGWRGRREGRARRSGVEAAVTGGVEERVDPSEGQALAGSVRVCVECWPGPRRGCGESQSQGRRGDVPKLTTAFFPRGAVAGHARKVRWRRCCCCAGRCCPGGMGMAGSASCRCWSFDSWHNTTTAGMRSRKMELRNRAAGSSRRAHIPSPIRTAAQQHLSGARDPRSP